MKAACFLALALTAAVCRAETSPFALVPYPQSCVQPQSVHAVPPSGVAGLAIVRKTDASLPSGGYRLSVTTAAVTVWSSDEAGASSSRATTRRPTPSGRT